MKRRLIGFVKLLWLALVALGLWWFLQTYDLRDLLDGQSWTHSLMAVGLVIMAHIGVLLTQAEAIRANGPVADIEANARIFNLTNLSKYIPVSGANLVVNGVMIRNLGHTVKGATSALLLLTYWTLLGACVFGAAAAGSLVGMPLMVGVLIGLMGGGIALALRPERFFGITGQYRVSGVILGQALIWTGYGLAFALVLSTGSDSVRQMALYGSAYDLSFGAGMLAIFAPSGVGVREAITALTIEGRDQPSIIAATLYLRALILVADLMFYGLFWIRDLTRRVRT